MENLWDIRKTILWEEKNTFLVVHGGWQPQYLMAIRYF